MMILARIEDIPEQGSKAFTVNDMSVFAVKQQGKIYLYRNQCPHIGVPLEWVEDQFLDPSKSMIQCANHGALFVIENGECVAGPCAGKALTPVAFDLVNGEIQISAASL